MISAGTNSSSIFGQSSEDEPIVIPKRPRWNEYTQENKSISSDPCVHTLELDMIHNKIQCAMVKNTAIACSLMNATSISSFAAKKGARIQASCGDITLDKLYFTKQYRCYDFTKLSSAQMHSRSVSEKIHYNGNKGLGFNITKTTTSKSNAVMPLDYLDGRNSVFFKDVIVNVSDITPFLLKCLEFGNVMSFSVFEEMAVVVTFTDAQSAAQCANGMKGQISLCQH